MSALTPLGLNLSGLITQIISFIILFTILYKLLYQPVINMLDQRSAKIKDNLDAAEKAKQDIAKSEESIQDSLEEAKNERRQMIVDAKEAAAKVLERLGASLTSLMLMAIVLVVVFTPSEALNVKLYEVAVS